MADTKDVTVTPMTAPPPISPWIIVGAIAVVGIIGAILFATRR